MKIVIDARIISSSTGRYVERLLTYLEKIDMTNKYVVLVPSKDKSYWTPINPNFSVEISDVPNFSFAEQIQFKRQLDVLHPDLVHFCMPQQPVLYRGRKVTTIHDLSQLRFYNPDKNWLVYRLKQLIGWFVFKYVIRTSDAILTDSYFSEKDIVAFSPTATDKINTIHLSADRLGTGSSIPYLLPSENFIMYVGQQATHKNIRRLIEAHQQLLDSHPDLQLVLVGKINPATKRIQKFVKDNSFKNVVFTGFVPDENLAWLYEHCLAYIFPSLAEGFGMPALEAMQHNAPVVSSNATCLPEVCGEAALYFDPYNIKQMTETIQTVIDSPDIRKILIAHGKRQVAKYSWRHMAEKTHEVYMATILNS
ncbi:glycosyltransferase family 1 protein [Candidatus Saccharibacteria bacterium]|nr:glycosyltransferase family 1 protein [Candidatus Saccharibacteria bacterium]